MTRTASTDWQPYGPYLSVRLIGTPTPQGSMNSYGKGRPMVHSNKAVLKPWRDSLVSAIREHMETDIIFTPDGAWPLTGPIGVYAAFTVAKPASAPKRTRIWAAKRPDLDKYVRALLDSLTMSGCIADDGQVVDLHAIKTYPGEHPQALDVPGIIFRVYTIGEL